MRQHLIQSEQGTQLRRRGEANLGQMHLDSIDSGRASGDGGASGRGVESGATEEIKADEPTIASLPRLGAPIASWRQREEPVRKQG